ncbi:MAG: putative ubiquitin-RnfH superfamily antitoxin RatB of RatAB toxin-antitoxin module [Gammaproteobacteria bacterium]|jgi:putative ubiquitin-RnfH superfamily antitoxin RatB of RatAB toxin-antitoxin module
MVSELESPLAVDVIYARGDVQEIIAVELPKGGTIRAAIERSRLVERYPEIDLAVNKVGVFGTLKSLSDLVQAGDRVEIYRPLLVDPKQGRRDNASAAKAARAKAKSGS